MNEIEESQIHQGGRPEREPAGKEGGPAGAPETAKPPEVRNREGLQRKVHAVIIKAQENLKPKAGELGQDRTKRRQALKEVLQEKKVKVDGKELKLSEAIVELTKAIAVDESSPEHSLVKGLKVTSTDIEENSEFGWVLAKIVSLNAISEQTKPFFVLALEAAHRGGSEAKPLLRAIVAKLISLVRRSRKDRDDLKDKAAEILKLIMQAEAGEIPWAIVIEKYGLLEQGDLRTEDIERFTQTDVTEKSIEQVLRVGQEMVEPETRAGGGLAAAPGRSIEEYERQIRAVSGFEPTLPGHARLLTAINQINAYRGIAELPLKEITKQMERLTELSGETAGIPELQALTFDLWLELANREREILRAQETRKKEEYQRMIEDRRYPHLRLIQDKREEFNLAAPNFQRISADLRADLQTNFQNIVRTIEDRVDRENTPPAPYELEAFAEQIEEQIEGYLDDPEVSLEDKQELEQIKAQTEAELTRVRGVAVGILNEIPIFERWTSIGFEPKELEAIRNKNTVMDWVRERLVAIEEHEHKHSTHEPEVRGIASKLHWVPEFLMSLDDSYWTSPAGKKMLRRVKEMISLRLHLHDHYHGYVREEIQELRATASALGIGGVVMAESNHFFENGKVQIAKDTFIRMLMRVRTARVELTDSANDRDFGRKGDYYIGNKRITPYEDIKARKETMRFLEERIGEGKLFASREEAEEILRVAIRVATSEQTYTSLQSEGMIDTPELLAKLQEADPYDSEFGRPQVEATSFYHNFMLKWHVLATPYEARLRGILESLGKYRAQFYEQHRGGKLTQREYMQLGKNELDGICKINTYWDSSWKIKGLLRSLGRRYSEVAGENTPAQGLLKEYEEEMAVGMRLSKAANDYYRKADEFMLYHAARRDRYTQKTFERASKGKPFNELYNKAKQQVFKSEDKDGEATARAEYLTALGKGIKARPLIFAKILANNEGFNSFLANTFRDRTDYFGGIDNYVTLEEKLGSLLYPIYDRVVHPRGDAEQDAPFAQAGKRSLFINSADLRPEEKRWVAQQLPDGVTEDGFFQAVNALHGYLTGQITELTDNPLYRRSLSKTLFIDDIPFAELHDTEVDYQVINPQKPAESIERVRKDGLLTFSQETMQGGYRDALVRANNDLYHAWQDVLPKILENISETHDPEKSVELTSEAMKAAKSYNSPMNTIAIGVITVEALQGAKADAFWNVTGLAGKISFLRTSQAQRDFGTEARSLTTEQLFELYKRLALRYGMPDLMYPGFDSFAKERLGFHFLGRNIDKIRLLVFLASMGLLKEIWERFEDED